MKKISIVGAGLCGSLLAIRLAQRGFEVALFEKRSDMRLDQSESGRSINLALSDRGLKALGMVGMEDQIRSYCIPMHGRMLHSKEGVLHFSKYSGREDEYINSVSRGGLNIALLNKAEAHDNISIYFNHQCLNVDHHSAKAKFHNFQSGEDLEVESDVLFGTDGAGSVVRRSLMAHTTELLFNYQQDFLRHGYKELCIPPDENGDCRIEKNALHIWPRGEYMVIALPNLDHSFTVTMFHPYKGYAGFERLDEEKELLAFFREEYPDILEHMPDLINDYFENPVGTLGTIKCYPWQSNGKVCILGDASHAIVPFYGQGMNASFEDVLVLDGIMDEHEGDWLKILESFQDQRKVDADAIADLAIDNFYEMRDKVDDKEFVEKRKLEMQLEKKFPEYYSKYSLVTFKEEISYSEAMKRGRKQDKWLLDLCRTGKHNEMSLEEVFEAIQKI